MILASHLKTAKSLIMSGFWVNNTISTAEVIMN
jgi:hypothetical protein